MAANVLTTNQIENAHSGRGRNRLWLRGRLMTGPEIKPVIGTFVAMIVPLGLFLGMPAFDFVQHRQPWVFAVTLILGILSIIFFGAGVFSDPGILPRNTNRNDQNCPYRQRVQDFVVNGTTVQLKYCETCRIYRPPRTVHCSICDNCVHDFDHHCPYLGNCVGSGNYRAFTAFVYALSFTILFVLACSIYHMVYFTNRIREQSASTGSGTMESGGSAFVQDLARNPIDLIIAIYCFIALFFVVGLCGFHVFLVCRGETTNEQLKHAHSHRSPFSRGPIQNFLAILFERPVRFLNVSKLYSPGAQISKFEQPQLIPLTMLELHALAERANDIQLQRDTEDLQLQSYLSQSASTSIDAPHSPSQHDKVLEDRHQSSFKSIPQKQLSFTTGSPQPNHPINNALSSTSAHDV